MCSLTVQMRMVIMEVVTTDAVGIWDCIANNVKSFGNDLNMVLMWPLALASAVRGLALRARASPRPRIRPAPNSGWTWGC